jgi:hypothetical protein
MHDVLLTTLYQERLHFQKINYNHFHQSLIGLTVIDAELCGEDHGSIPHNCDREDALSS